MSPRKGRTHRVIPPLAKGRGQFCSVRDRPEDDRYVSLTFDAVMFQKYVHYNIFLLSVECTGCGKFKLLFLKIYEFSSNVLVRLDRLALSNLKTKANKSHCCGANL